MAGGRSLPEKPQDKDLRAIVSRIHYLGSISADPSDPGEGKAWIRSDLSPPQLRARIGGATYKVDLTAV